MILAKFANQGAHMQSLLAVKDAMRGLETKLLSLEIKVDADDGANMTISGYGSVFGNKDAGGDIVMPGAFKDSIANLKPKMLWQHDPSQPIGVWDEVREDENGLFVKGHFLEDVARAREAAAMVRGGAIDGLSIGFRIMPDGSDFEDGVRILTKLQLWEVSVVTFPMNELASIYAMKSENMTERDLERMFKDMGHSHRMAKAMAGGAWKGRAEVLRDVDAGDPEQVQRDVDELKKLLVEMLEKKGTRDE